MNEGDPKHKAQEVFKSMDQISDFEKAVSRAVLGMTGAEYDEFINELKKIIREEKANDRNQTN